FCRRLYQHLLARLQNRARPSLRVLKTCVNFSSGTPISLLDNVIHSHKALLLQGTAGHEGLIIRTVGSRANVAILNSSCASSKSSGDTRSIQYARVEGIFHGDVVTRIGDHDGDAATSERIEFLWVRWLTSQGRSMGAEGLDLLSLPPLSDPSCFGFVDPKTVVRDCHLVPKFSKENLEVQSIESRSTPRHATSGNQTKVFFLNPFVLDRNPSGY
ncbi:hypothetical protein BKA70DRAFT_1108329, partial [Coprinopsis sp. MPI-PUGE-AT-0042]